MALLIKLHRAKGQSVYEDLADWVVWSEEFPDPSDHRLNNEALLIIFSIINSYREGVRIKGYTQQDIWHAALSIIYEHGLELANA